MKKGRTARMDRSGDSLLFLAPSEIAYIDFLQLKKVPIEEISLSKKKIDLDLLPFLKQQQLTDRELMEKSRAAFVSFVRGYKEHQCNFIFSLETLGLGFFFLFFF